MHESDNYTRRTSTLDCFCVCGGMCVLTITLCHWRSWWWLLVNIEQLDLVQELPTGWTWASCHINIDAHNSDQLEAVCNLPRGQIRVSDISFKVQAKRLWEWMAFIRTVLQYVQYFTNIGFPVMAYTCCVIANRCWYPLHVIYVLP